MIKPRIFLVLMFSMQAGLGQQMNLSLDSVAKQLGETFMKDTQSAGLSIGIYTNGNSHFYNFGTTEKGKNSTASETTLYQIGSITKTFAAYLLAKAVADKKANLSDDIRKYIPGNYPNLAFNGQPIRLVHLANTTAGMPEWIPAEPISAKKVPADTAYLLKAAFYGKLTRKDFFEALHLVKPDTIPGTKRRHSNSGAQLLAYILENIYHTAFEELVHQYILAPNGMKHTAFTVPSAEEHLLAIGYDENGQPARSESRLPYFRSMSGLQSCTADLLKYIGLMLGQKNAIVQTTLQPTIHVDLQTGAVTSARAEDPINASFYSAALNWFIYQYDDTKQTQVWADGGTAGFNSYLVFYPGLNSGIVVLANKSDEKTFRALPGIAYDIFRFIQQNDHGNKNE